MKNVKIAAELAIMAAITFGVAKGSALLIDYVVGHKTWFTTPLWEYFV